VVKRKKGKKGRERRGRREKSNAYIVGLCGREHGKGFPSQLPLLRCSAASTVLPFS
jgi:hypothetical protein